jgi:hypothetical protein
MVNRDVDGQKEDRDKGCEGGQFHDLRMTDLSNAVNRSLNRP